jgi:hypothetical protein
MPTKPQKPTPWQIAGPKPWPEPDTKRNLQRTAAYIHLQWDKPRAWGERDTPAPSLHAKDIEVGLGLDEESGCQLYLGLKEDTLHFRNPTPEKLACYQLTEEGTRWAEGLMADCQRGFKSWLLDWKRD